MSRSRKIKIVQKTSQSPELSDMFNSMMGVSAPDVNIVLPKFKKIHSCASQVLQILHSFCKSAYISAYREMFSVGIAEIIQFITKSKAELSGIHIEQNDKTLTPTEITTINSDPTKLEEFLKSLNNEYNPMEVSAQYKKLKECNTVKEMIMIARNLQSLVAEEKNRSRSTIGCLDNQNNLSDKFILDAEGDYLHIFNFSSLDFKQLLLNDLANTERKSSTDGKNYLLIVLHLIYIRVVDIVKEVTSPDIDIDHFIDLVSKSIGDMKKQIPRCDKAFDKILASTSVLKENFGEYYKDFVVSQNSHPGIMVQNFILDVAKQNTADIKVAHQFRTIIEFYRTKITSQKIDNPNIKAMLSMVGENMSILESKLDKK